MRLYLRLLGLQINQRLGLSVLRAGWQQSKGRTLARGALYLFLAIAFASILVMYVWLINALLPSFQALGLEKLLLGIVLLVSMVIVFFMGMIYLIGVLFFSKDTEFLAALPIPQRTVFAAKFSQVLLGEIATGLLLLVPPFIIYGISIDAGVGYWLRAAVVALAAPCIPLALSALLSLLLMRFTALWRRRELLTTIGSILLLVGIILGQMYLTSSIPDDMSQEAILAMISNSSALLQSVVSFFPPSGWAAEGIIGNGGMLALFLGVSVVAMTLVTLIAGKLYYSGAKAQLETLSTKRKVSFSGGSVRMHSALYAMVIREWRTMLRSPVYVLNGLSTIVVGPILLIIPKVVQNSSAGGIGFDQLFALLDGAVDTGILVLILAAVFVVISLISPAATTSISREGKLFSLLRMIPMSPTRQILSKYVFSLTIAIPAMLLMGVTATLLMGFSIVHVLLALALAVAVTIAPQALSMLPDVIKPKLAWNSETEAIKQNMNALMGMFIGIAYLFAVGYGCVLLLRGGMETTAVIGLLVAAAVVLGAASLLALCSAARRSWRAIEG